MNEILRKTNYGWRHMSIGRLRIGFKFGIYRLGYDSMGDGDGRLSLGLMLCYWIWRGDERKEKP